MIHKRGGQDVRLLADGSESAACLASTQFRRQDLRIHWLRSDDVRNREGTRPVLSGGDSLHIHLIAASPLSLKSLHQEPCHQDVVATVLSSRSSAYNTHFIESEQFLENSTRVQERSNQNTRGLPTMAQGLSTVCCGEDDGLSADPFRFVLLGGVAEVEPLDRKTVSFPREDYLAWRKLVGDTLRFLNFLARNDFFGSGLECAGDRGRRPQDIDHDHRFSRKFLRRNQRGQGVYIQLLVHVSSLCWFNECCNSLFWKYLRLANDVRVLPRGFELRYGTLRCSHGPLRGLLPDYHNRDGLPTLASALYNIAMSSHGFADFLERLQTDGRLVRRDEPVQKELEAGAEANEAAPQAALFTDVSDARFPLILGVFSSQERILAAFRASSSDEVAARIEEMGGCENGKSWLERLSGDRPNSLRKNQPKSLRTGPSQQIVHLGRDVDLDALPTPTFHSDEECPALTAGRLITRGPDGGHLYVGCHDFRVIDSRQLVACWRPSSKPARLLAHYGRRGESMPVAIAFGGEPADLLIAMAPLPRRTDVLELTGSLRGSPCEMIQGRCVDLPVPADAELVIEGTIGPHEPCAEAGSGLDAMGQLRRLQPGPLVRVETVTHRPTPLFPSFRPGEKGCIHQVLAKAFLPFLRAELPSLCKLEFPVFGGDRLWAFASIDKTYPGQASQFAKAFWGLSKMLPVRYLVIVDEDVDLGNSDEVWRAVASHAAPNPDVCVTDSIPDEFRHDEPPGRMVFDATRPLS